MVNLYQNTIKYTTLVLIINTFQQLRTAFILIVFTLFSTLVSGQQIEAADALVRQGIALHDAGQVDSALSKYRQALALDKDNLRALAEMAYSLWAIEKYEESISFSKRAIKTHPHDPELKTVYVSYGNALDGLGKTDKSIDIYNEGIKMFPVYAQLYYNRGISQNELHKTDEALHSFQKSAELNPDHAASHNAIGNLLFNHNNIASLLAFCRFLTLEPGTKQSTDNLENTLKIMNSHVTKSPEHRISVTVSPDMINSNKKNQQNNFSSVELELALSSALDNDSISIYKSAVEKFIQKFSALCGYLKETEKDNYGFYWDYYVPYFIEMNDKGFVTTFAYIAFATTKTADVTDWLDSHKNEVDAFYKWSDGFKWRIY
jgi:tetratricopeptide (TPR) repeat protein